MSDIINYKNAVDVIKTAILQSQARAAKAVNQEQLALYYGIGRYISENTRNHGWGTGVLKQISDSLRLELPGLRGFSETNLKNMRMFYEAWKSLESDSSVATDELANPYSVSLDKLGQATDNEQNTIRQLQLTNYTEFPLAEFLSISFTHHIAIINSAKDFDERLFYIRFCHNYKPTTEDLPDIIKKQDLYHHQDKMPNNFLATIPDYKQAYRAIRMFKDDYLLDFINVEELGMHDEDVDERVIESSIVHNVKNFIMTFGRGFAFCGSQVHYDKLGHDHWIDLLFFNRDLNRTVVFELKNGRFKAGYLGQLSAYLRILNDDDRRSHEEAPIGIILCRDADKEYADYIMQDFKQPMGVATYKTADEMDPDLLKALPPKEELQRVFEESSRKEEKD
ncbi:PDDEXK nuclease domain-containing protein [Prevotella communis]|uniref:PDDEXK nuclease domain-containing protein n=1 Tax=Prevotella communis TaxID=2913614 RepID=UPI001EDB10AF|nr:PDDEXK nuclease domain-containing protein [Prevotella communis]UKK58928.1 PDDEXK nuclease domain-containing protein [Prevotella communis]